MRPPQSKSYQNTPTPNVIVLEAPPGDSNLIERLDALALLCDAGTKVVVIGRTNDITFYRKLVTRGVNEYLVAPVQVVDFLRALSELFRAPGAKPLGRLVGVVGAKGGVGASTIAHNLAWSLASVSEMATIIADFDLAFGTAALNYNQDPPKASPTPSSSLIASTRHSSIAFFPSAASASVYLRRQRPLIARPTSRRRLSIRCSTPCDLRRR